MKLASIALRLVSLMFCIKSSYILFLGAIPWMGSFPGKSSESQNIKTFAVVASISFSAVGGRPIGLLNGLMWRVLGVSMALECILGW